MDSDLTDPMSAIMVVKDGMERRASEEAASTLIPKAEMDSFVLRAGPLYSKARINQFAQRMRIHPGIIVGQLQHRGEVGWSANREMLVKVRHIVTPVAPTDGWGHLIDLRSLV
jgi:HTH-type transcriptional regulator/antitoxin HigA